MEKIGDIVRRSMSEIKKEEKILKPKLELGTPKEVAGKGSMILPSPRFPSSLKFRRTGRRTSQWADTDQWLAVIRQWFLTALVFLLPLWFLPWGTDKIGLAKQLLMTILAGIGFIIWLYENMSKGKIVYRKSAINIGIWLLLLVVTISTVFSLDSIKSFYSSSANFVNLWNFILLGIFYLLVINSSVKVPRRDVGGSSKKKNQKIKLIDVFLLSSGIVIFYSLIKLFGLDVLGGFTKTMGFNPIGTINSVAILAGLTFILGLGRFILNSRITIHESRTRTRRTSPTCAGGNLDGRWNQNSKLLRGALIGIALFSFIFLFLVNFRIVWYGLILGAVLMIIAKVRREKDAQIKSFSLPIAVLVVSLVFVLWGIFGARIGIEQPQTNLKNLPTEVYPTFKTSLEIANKTLNQRSNLEQMFFGVGSGNFNKMWLLHRPLDLNQTDFWQARFYQGYSSFTTWMVETGYLGIISMLSLFTVVLLQGVKKKKDLLNELNNVYLSISIAYLTLMWFLCSFNLTLYFAFFLLIALLVKNNPKKEIDFTHPIKKALVLSLASVLMMVAMIFAGYFSIQRHISSAYAFRGMAEQVINTEGLEQKEIIAKAQEELNKKINFLTKAYNLDRSNDEALRVASQLYLNKTNLALQSQDKNVSNYVQSALIYARKAIEIDITEYQNYANLAQIYENLITFASDAYGFAISNYGEALKLNPGNPFLIFSMARSQFSEAVRLAGQIGVAEVSEEDKKQLSDKQALLLEQSIENLKKAISLKLNYTPAHFLLVQIYDVQGKIDEAIVSASNLVILNQKDAGIWFRLGILHYKKDDFKKAEVALSEAVRLMNDYSNARYFLGLVYSKTGRKDEALAQFKEVVKLNPENQEIKTIVKNLENNRPPLEGISPPAELPEERTKTPIEETKKY